MLQFIQCWSDLRFELWLEADERQPSQRPAAPFSADPAVRAEDVGPCSFKMLQDFIHHHGHLPFVAT